MFLSMKKIKLNYQLAMIKRWKSLEYRKKCFITWNSNSYKERRRKCTTKLWEDDVYVEKVLKGLNQGIRKRPTSYEKIIIDLIKNQYVKPLACFKDRLYNKTFTISREKTQSYIDEI